MKNRILYISLFIFIFVGLFADFLANDKPIMYKDNKGYHISVFTDNFNKKSDIKIILNPLIRYSNHSIDMDNAGYISPFADQNLKNGKQRHYLGTDQLGRDVLAGMIYGAALALKVGLASMLLAFILGLLMSLYPSYYGDDGLKLNISSSISILFFLLSLIYILIYFDEFTSTVFSTTKHRLIFIITTILFFLILHFGLGKIKLFKRRIAIPLDSTFTLLTKLFQSLPGSFLILILISLFATPSVYNIILVIAILKWPVISRYVRAEMLKIKEEKFIESSKAIGLKNRIIIWRHALPHTLTPVIVALSFGFAGTILLESTLSFLGIGIPADHVSWGSLLSEARHNYSAWWLAVFPGLAIFVTILIFNTIGNMFLKKISRE